MCKLIKTGLLICLMCSLSPALQAQGIYHLDELTPQTDPVDQIQVQRLYGDSTSSTFLIWVADKVALHYHALHSEQVYIIQGRGVMVLGSQSFDIEPGMLISIPMGTPHSVAVTSEEPLKVLSVQSPEFLGKDRVYINK